MSESGAGPDSAGAAPEPEGDDSMAHLARPLCTTAGCTRKAVARVAGKWLCVKHLQAEKKPVAGARR